MGIRTRLRFQISRTTPRMPSVMTDSRYPMEYVAPDRKTRRTVHTSAEESDALRCGFRPAIWDEETAAALKIYAEKQREKSG